MQYNGPAAARIGVFYAGGAEMRFELRMMDWSALTALANSTELYVAEVHG